MKAINLELQILVEESKPWLDLTTEQQEIVLMAISDIEFEIESFASSTKSVYNLNDFKVPLKLYSDDGKMIFLGEVTSNKYDGDGIFNEFGTFGSKFSSDSIWNTFGTYGSEFSSYSAFNSFATNPPVIMDSNFNIVGRLTKNKFVEGAISPYDIKLLLEELGL